MCIIDRRYITDRFLPDKAIDLIDEACSDMNLHDKNINRRMELRRELDDYAKERELLEAETENPDFERLAELKSLELQAQDVYKRQTSPSAPATASSTR